MTPPAECADGACMLMGAFSANRELINGGIIVGFTRLEYGIRKIGMVDCIGHFLRFKAKRSLRILRISTFQRMLGIIQKISGIELNTRLIGINLHQSAAVRLINLYAKRGILRLAAGKAEAMIVSAGKVEIVVRKIKIVANGFGLAEIKLSSRYRADLARGDQGFVGRQVCVGIHCRKFCRRNSRRG